MPASRRLSILGRHVQPAHAADSEYPDGDPAPGPGPDGALVVYGIPTSRVCKVLWMCAEVSGPPNQGPVSPAPPPPPPPAPPP
eukprot:COSAG04_NODE_150_length_22521_cov_10.008385_18_plen_82_part_01